MMMYHNVSGISCKQGHKILNNTHLGFVKTESFNSLYIQQLVPQTHIHVLSPPVFPTDDEMGRLSTMP